MQSRAVQSTMKTTRNERWRGALTGLVPLGLLVGIVGLALALTALVRVVTSGQDVATEKAAPLITFAVGGVVAVVTSSLALVRTWRRMRAWQQAGNAAQAAGAFWALALTPLIVSLPVLLALVIPQHPAP
jgi:hypothetical protein